MNDPQTIIHPFPEPPHASQKTSLSLVKLIPNCLTLSALILGVTSIQFAINGKFEQAVVMLLLAAILDLLDGAVARALKAQSDFGAELDSLSDFLAFGIAPSVLLYQWALDDAGKLGWIATIVLPAAAALRLARFNVASKQKPMDEPVWKKGFFTGVPTPAGAGLVMLPVYIWFLSPETFTVFSFATPLIAVWTIIVAVMMISRIPTFSFKAFHMSQKMMVPVMGLFAMLIAALIHVPWITLSVIAIGYLASLPFVFSSYRKQEKLHGHTEDFSSLAFGIPMDDHKKSDDDLI
jgi:CDP-diacylglycerol--serine O-phosphatidyltransferase